MLKKDIFEQSSKAVFEWQQGSATFMARDDPSERWAAAHKSAGVAGAAVDRS